MDRASRIRRHPYLLMLCLGATGFILVTRQPVDQGGRSYPAPGNSSAFADPPRADRSTAAAADAISPL
jgi:hypothetical protein